MRLVFCIIISLHLSADFFAQSGPGGVGNAGTNVLWLSADFGVYNNAGSTAAGNGDNVQQWNDRSGNVKHAQQNTLANRPNFITGVINGLPVVRYSASSADLLIAAGVQTANAASVWAVADYASLPSSNPGILIGSPAGSGNNVGVNDKCIGMWVANSGSVWGRGVQSNSTSRDISQTTALSANTFYIINNIYRSAGINQYVNNSSAGTNALFNGTLRSWADVSVGRQGAESWNGDIAEVIFYNVEVNAAQRIIIDNYLAAKYNRTLATNDLYNKDDAGNGNFDHEVAGIGRIDASNLHSDSQGSGIVRIMNPTNLGDSEFLFWGHNDLSLQATNNTDIPASIQARMERVWRVSEVNTAGTAVNVGNITLRWNLSGLGPVTAADLRLLVDSDNDGLFSDETPISGATAVGGGIYEFANISAISNNLRFTLGTTNKIQTPLPVELLEFNLNCLEGAGVKIAWSTATEKNNAGFDIERSADGVEWSPLKFIKGAGNSVVKQKYKYLDDMPLDGTSYYRLIQRDEEGSKKVHPASYVKCQGYLRDLIVFPNPASENVFIPCEKNVEVQLFDGKGARLETSEMIEWHADRKMAEINVRQLPSGLYILRAGHKSIRLIIGSD